MKKKKLGISLLILAAVCIGALALLFCISEKRLFHGTIEEQVRSSGSAEEMHTKTLQFTLEESGSYRMDVQWTPEPKGILAGLVIRDTEGNINFYCTGELLQVESKAMKLEKGTYEATLYFITNKTQLEEFIRIAKPKEEIFYNGWSGGEHKIEGEYDVYKVWPETTEGLRLYVAVVIGIGCIVGLILTGCLLMASTKDGKIKRDYDERQQLVRGRGFKYGFFTMMICNGLSVFLFICMEKPFMDAATASTVSIIIAIVVYVSYCIWNEGYFSLNENPKKVVVLFLIIGVFNVVAFIGNAVHGNVIQDGVLTFRGINLVCALMVAVVLLVLLLKRINRKREDN